MDWKIWMALHGKVANQVKLAIPSHSEPLWWEKIRKVANHLKLAIPSHSEPLRWEKIGGVANRAKLAILSWWLTFIAWIALLIIRI